MFQKIAPQKHTQSSTQQLEAALAASKDPAEQQQIREELTRRYRDYYYQLASDRHKRHRRAGSGRSTGRGQRWLLPVVAALLVVVVLLLLVVF
jgi:Flp pilus assembly protein TadB